MRQGIFLPESTFSAHSLSVSVHPLCAIACIYIGVHVQDPVSPHQSSVDYENIKTPSMHRRLGSATLSQLAFPWESNPNFRWEKSHWGNTFVESKWKKRTKKIGFRDSFAPCGSDATSGGCAEFVTAPWSASCRWRTEHYIFHVLDFCRHRCRCRAEPPI